MLSEYSNLTVIQVNLLLASILAGFFVVGCSGESAEQTNALDQFVEGDKISLSEATTLGDEEGTLFAQPVGVFLGPDGYLYAADVGYRDVRVFSTGGELITTIGGPGQGPGEFRAPSDLAFGAGDSLFVFDGAQRRIAVFSSPPDPTFAYNIPLEPSAGRMSSDGILATRDGRLYTTFSRGVNPEDDEEGTWLVQIDRSGQIVEDSLASLPPMETIRESQDGGSMRVLVKPFGRRAVFSARPNGYPCYAWTGTLTIRCLGEDNTAEISVEMDVEPVPVSREDRQRHLASVEGFPGADSMIEEAGWHDTHPAFSTFSIDRMGRFWIQLSAEGDAQTSIWYVIDPEDDEVRMARVPTNELIFSANATQAFAVRFLETEEVRLVVYDYE